MVTKGDKKVSKSTKIKKSQEVLEEDDFDRRWREREEKRKRDAQAIEDKKIAEKKEKEMSDKVIIDYLDKLEAHLEEKKSVHWWTQVDKSGFKRFVSKDEKIIKMVNKEPEKYIDKQFAEYIVFFHQNEKPDSIHRSSGVWMHVTIRIYNIKKDTKKENKLTIAISNDYSMTWKSEDFKITKFSFKLMEKFLRPLAEKKFSRNTIFGTPINSTIKTVEKYANVDFSDCLNPLAGV
jgi:hypothetical protein